MIDHRPYTHKVDVYSFGIVLWELCTAEWPFEGLSFVQLVHAIVLERVLDSVDAAACGGSRARHVLTSTAGVG
ncbi:hypothetical protein CBR_g2876 [Chara braunii]|uniref:Protein kinase domain-containing protein n=1 Tax=Chara braunii TaxID=69332 RepID=A0A388KE46_CHABU|nr:hypothetical protein CBR_g2876 [Chara braunii]|eukprot:GBG68332.1 hypothetical protein CBR_g2876 [Chara braunii]